MAHTVDSIPIAGLRKAHLFQLAAYIRNRDHDGWYYSPRDQFEARHKDLLELADLLERLWSDPDVRIAKKPENAVLINKRRDGNEI
jgi:hypothetical protein